MMGDLIQINLAQESYKSRSSLSSCTRLYNMSAENTLVTSPFKVPALFNTPNPKFWSDLGIPNDIYGFVVMNNFLYVVCGIKLFKINSNKAKEEVGELATAPNIVQMTQNGLQVTILTSSGISYYYTESDNTFAQIIDPNYQLASSVCTIDGYTIFSKRESGQFFVSELRDTSTYTQLYRATAEALSDNIVRVIAYNRQLYIVGSQSIEIWQSTGVGDPPFQRIDGAFVEIGSNAIGSIVTDWSGVYWLGNDNIVYGTNNYNPQRISTFGIEDQISRMKITADCISFTYTQAGHRYLCMTFLSEKQTLVCDLTTGLWQERGSFNSERTSQQQWCCLYGINFNNQIIVNGTVSGKLYYLDLNTYEEDGQEVLAEIVTSLVFENYNKFTISNLVLVVDSGVGLEEPAQGSNPMIMLDVSIDGGLNWKYRSPQPMGKIGKYRQRINWLNLGEAREFILRFRITDPVKRSILAAYIQPIDGGF